ncbi:glycyl-radical enzyme activating protein [Acetivibrio cellulolyticus]|uniref:glycyl-radical enzyme activating protein n=1 Tax=Acetivibrio cellulolyticus TaxID=35830 RepID=UPI0001E2F0DA|nr:glycyl-radical enzyme activating protein [Acetivibrio cellulolyticus]
MRYFDISWCSTKDGPGRRVVLFLQGCPLCCTWCHSPHSQSIGAPVLFFREYCTGCGKCRAVCKAGCFIVNGENHYFNETNCVRCGKCVLNCSHGALAYNLREGTPEEIFKEIKAELILLRNIGGITLSGGEPMLQYLEAKELLKLCKGMGAHTAIETSGAVNIKCFEELLEYVDCWLFGLKQTDAEKCCAMTGADFNNIEQNLNFLASLVPDKIIIRTPIIEGFTDDIYNIQRIYEIMLSHSLNTIELLPYNPHTGHYYKAMGKDFDEQKFKLPSEDILKNIVNILKLKGINIKLLV